MIFSTLILSIFLGQDAQTQNPELRAGMFLGARAAQLQKKLPILNHVVIVPDEATYLDEISQWSTSARWPVFFDQEPFMSSFIRRFSPE